MLEKRTLLQINKFANGVACSASGSYHQLRGGFALGVAELVQVAAQHR